VSEQEQCSGEKMALQHCRAIYLSPAARWAVISSWYCILSIWCLVVRPSVAVLMAWYMLLDMILHNLKFLSWFRNIFVFGLLSYTAH